jgi:AcrR family transcriptional regulator
MDRKDAILKTVLKLVNREGFYHLNMKKIAAEAGVAAGTIYVHFKGKEELINALYKMVVTDFNAQVMSGYIPGRDFSENFFTMLGNALDFYLDDPDRFSFIEQYTYAPFMFKDTQEENFIILQPIYKIMKEAKRKKLVKNLPDAMLVALILGPVTTMMKLYLAHKTDLDRKATKQKLLQACWENIALAAS